MCNEHNLNIGNKIITNKNSSLLKHESNRKAILINGLPASGKSFLGRKLAYQYNAPLLTLDTIKEALFDTLGIGDREYNRSLSKASKEIIWALIAEFPKDSLVIVDAWFGFPPFNKVSNGLEHAGISNFIELWCNAPGYILAKRYLDRVDFRHKGHPGSEYAPELAEVAEKAAPMNIGPVYSIDMIDLNLIDYQAIINWTSKELHIPIQNG